MFLLTTVSVNDGFAYLFGKAFGKHRLAPHISPKKTWEGFIPALICSTAIWFVLLIFPGVQIEIWQCIVFGLLCGIAGVLGDLVESRMKRNSGVKDSGTLMPGHGGLLDRLDSIFLVSLTCALLMFTFNCIPF
ncbi:MAG: phosphatidate cytidylyltransferase [Coriobacteriia bacterium]|nr:phosphatidate cytidylyltransferase [Coriobacteriia bacterium]